MICLNPSYFDVRRIPRVLIHLFFGGGLPDHNSHYVKSTVCTLLPSQLSSIIFPTVPFGIFDIAKENNPFSLVP